MLDPVGDGTPEKMMSSDINASVGPTGAVDATASFDDSALLSQLESIVTLGSGKRKKGEGSKHCLRLYIRNKTTSVKKEKTNCRCVELLLLARENSDDSWSKKANEVSRWCKLVSDEATGPNGNWAKASEIIRSCSKVGVYTKLSMANVTCIGTGDGTQLEGGECSLMCLYSMWSLIRVKNWEVEDSEGTMLKDATVFQVEYLHTLAELVVVDVTKAESRMFMMVYGNELVQGRGLLCSNSEFKATICKRMDQWAEQSGHKKKSGGKTTITLAYTNFWFAVHLVTMLQHQWQIPGLQKSANLLTVSALI